MSTPQRDSDLILDIVKFLQLQPDKPLDIIRYCTSKWSDNKNQYKTYIDFLLFHNLIQSTSTNENLYIPTLEGIKISEDDLGTLVNNHARTHTKTETYLVSNPLDFLPAVKPKYQVSNDEKKIAIKTMLISFWEVISKNPLISTIIGTVIGTIFLKIFGVI